jgi:RNA recognition motif. (a.k.a. RRM, RBD, or RNP domain)
LLTRHTGGPVSDEEARNVLERFGAIEETCPISVGDQKVANLPEGRWVKFAYFQDCCDAQYVCSLSCFSHGHNLTLSQAFKHHEFFRLVIHRADDARARRNRPNNSPFRNRTPGRLHNQSSATSSWVPDAHAIFIGDLPMDATDDQVRQVFQAFGHIVSLNVLRRRVEDSK